ncbi:hypothetical protein [Nocardia transvalensis]|uniref:hypothetical protein n=1 Tax=Nocardia transvalensis TaxID=37333 RepID=UPI0012F63360|nr:hypothetical protein [Nocardia transvalensis]
MGIPNFGTVASQIGHSLTSWMAGEEIPDATSPATVQDRYNRQRDSVRGDAGRIGYDGAFRPQSVHTTDNFEQHDLAALRTKVDKIDLKAVGDLIEAWRKIGVNETTSLQTFQQAMAKATDEGIWRGESRTAAAQAVTDYTTQASQVAKAAALTSNKLSELRTGLEPTKDLVPHVPEHRTGIDNFRHWMAGRHWKNDDSAYYNAYTEAKRVLKTVYAPVVHESDTNVPVIPKPNEQKPPVPGGDQPPPPGSRAATSRAARTGPVVPTPPAAIRRRSPVTRIPAPRTRIPIIRSRIRRIRASSRGAGIPGIRRAPIRRPRRRRPVSIRMPPGRPCRAVSVAPESVAGPAESAVAQGARVRACPAAWAVVRPSPPSREPGPVSGRAWARPRAAPGPRACPAWARAPRAAARARRRKSAPRAFPTTSSPRNTATS